MRKNFGAQSWLYPMPVLMIATWNEDGSPNVMNAAWGGIHDTNQIGVCIDPGHKTAENIRRTGCFTVSLADAANVVECDFAGIVSGNDDPEKFARTKWHAAASGFVNAPIIEELAFTLECKLISYDSGQGCTVGEIVNVSIDDRILGEDGKVDPEKLQVLCYDPVHHVYRTLGGIAGTAFKDGLLLKK